MFDSHTLLTLFPVPLVLSLTVHEWAHACSAYRLGDDTAARQGRLTLNPIAHIDPIGTFLAPLLGVPFGWAKPVPVNPLRFRRDVSMRCRDVLTAAAGPVSNLILAVVCSVAVGLLLRSATLAAGRRSALVLPGDAIGLNVALFALQPDARAAARREPRGRRLHPLRLRPQWDTYPQYGLPPAPPDLGQPDLLAGPMAYISEPLNRLSYRIARRLRIRQRTRDCKLRRSAGAPPLRAVHARSRPPRAP